MNLNLIEDELNKLKTENNLRTLKTYSDNLLNLSSNDYLGLNEDILLRENFYKKYPNLPLSSSSSRLITGSYSLIMDLENKLEEIYKKPALVFNTGFDGNCCVIETMANKNTLILSDKLNHASIHDGIIHSGAKLLRYRHLDLNHLESLLLKYENEYDDILVISETTYSMDGDEVDLKKLTSLKDKYNFQLMIDEAHSYGVHGYGIAYNLNLLDKIDFLLIPLGKGGASIGAYLITNKIFKEYLINKGRKFIYTTALPPINVAWNLYILENMNNFKNKITALEDLRVYTKNKIESLGLETISTSQIISIIIGTNEKTIELCNRLLKKGYLLYPIKEPTVPRGTARLRIGLNPHITKEQINNFMEDLNYELNSIL
ncbi:aminotransferase class I/II-fold pyridoxal phosphate-dependent enzyme [Cetobacterium ceti]